MRVLKINDFVKTTGDLFKGALFFQVPSGGGLIQEGGVFKGELFKVIQNSVIGVA